MQTQISYTNSKNTYVLKYLCKSTDVKFVSLSAWPQEGCSARDDLWHGVADLHGELEEEGGGHHGEALAHYQQARHPHLQPSMYRYVDSCRDIYR